MRKPWYRPQTKQQKADYDRVCRQLYAKFGSYPKIAATLSIRGDEYIAAQTVRMWFRDRKIPAHHAVMLASMITANPYHLLPWLESYIKNWEWFQQPEKDHE